MYILNVFEKKKNKIKNKEVYSIYDLSLNFNATHEGLDGQKKWERRESVCQIKME